MQSRTHAQAGAETGMRLAKWKKNAVAEVLIVGGREGSWQMPGIFVRT